MLRNRYVRSIVLQALIVLLVVGLVVYLAGNAAEGLRRQGLGKGFVFLLQPIEAQLQNPLIDNPSSSVAWIFVAGTVNTVLMGILACAASTVIGVFVGILALSTNRLLKLTTRVYVEVFRNTPLLVQLVLWYMIALNFPRPNTALNPLPGFFFSNRGLFLPSVQSEIPLTAILVLVLVTFFVWTNWRGRMRREHGNLVRGQYFWACLFALTIALAVWISKADVTLPERKGFSFAGGLKLSLEFGTLLFALVLYKSAQISEIVRGAILAVPQGQFDAAKALGMRQVLAYRLVILPFALRTTIPPLTNMYTDLFKLTSLGIAIGYPELMVTSQRVITRTAQPLETIAILMLIYFIVCASVSMFMNWINGLVKFKEN